MSILNRYVLKQFIKPFVASFSALCCLIFVSQVFDRLDRFLADGVNFAHVLGFLITSLPFQALQMLPIACLLGTLFVVGNLSRSREYIAGLAGGLPPEKFLSGLFWAGIGLSLIAFVANETVVPPSTRYARAVFQEKIRRLGTWRPTVFNNVIAAGADGRLWTASSVDGSSGLVQRVIVDQFKNDVLNSQINARAAQWTKDGWVFKEGVQRTYTSDGSKIETNRNFEEEIMEFSEKPSDFVIQEPQPEEMTFQNLKRQIRRMEMLGVPARSLEVELMTKLSFPFACFVVIFLGIPLALQGKGSRAIGIAAGGILTLLYLGFVQFGKALAQRLIEPWVGAWLGNFVFLGIGLILWWRMRRSA